METIIYLSKSAAILGIFYLVYIAVLQKDTFFKAKRHYLIGGIIASLLLPLIIFTKTVYVEVLPVADTFFSNNLIPVSETLIQESSGFTMSFWELIALVYFVGILFMSIRFLKQVVSLIILLKKYKSVKKGPYKYIQVTTNCTPFSFFNYIVYNPNLHTTEDLKMIIKHEQVHATQWHSVDIILTNLILIFQWMNPFAWLYKKSIEENLEFMADSETAHQVSSRKAYQLTLVKVLASNVEPLLTNKFYQSFIKKRIIMLHTKASRAQNKWKFALILPLLALFLWSFNVKEEVKYIEVNASDISKITNTEASYTVTAQTSISELRAIEKAFSNNEIKLKFTGLKTTSSNKIVSITISTKHSANNRFIKRMTINKADNGEIKPFKLQLNENGKDIVFSALQNEDDASVISEDKVTFTPEATVSTFTNKEKKIPLLGDDPLYIINGKKYRKSQLPKDKTIELDGSIKAYNIKEGEDKYGKEGKDGVLLFDGKSTFVSVKKDVKKAESKITMTIDKSTSDKELKKIKKVFKDNYDVKVTFSDVERNSDGEIIGIAIKVKSKSSSANFNTYSSEAIKPIQIYYESDSDSISLGSKENKSIFFNSKESGNSFIYEINEDTNGNGTTWIHKSGDTIHLNKNNNNLFFNSTDSIHFISKDKSKWKSKSKGNVYFYSTDSLHKNNNVWISDDGKTIHKKRKYSIIVNDGDDDDENFVIFNHKRNHFFLNSNGSENALFIIDGREVTDFKDEDIDPNTIDTVEVIKGDAAIKLYGDKAKNGVIIITTKKD